MLTINYGHNNWPKITYDTLTASDIGTYLKPNMSVAIKPNLVNITPPSHGATTHAEVVEGIIQFLLDYGIKDINIMEGSAVGNDTKKAFKALGYEDLKKKYRVGLIDLKQSPTKTLRHSGLDIQIAKPALDTDFLISVPVLKSHCQTRLTCSIKNLKGCIPEREMRRFHTLGLHTPIAVLAALLPVGYCVVDGICGDLSFEEGGSPVEQNRIIAGRNPVIVDSFCAELIGYRPTDISYLVKAKENGVGEFYSQNIKVIELNSDKKPKHQHKGARLSERYARLVDDDSACSVCYAALMYALHQTRGRSSKERICIGQGFAGKSIGNNKDDNTTADTAANTIGIGNCCSGFASFVPGCPPKAVEIVEALNKFSR